MKMPFPGMDPYLEHPLLWPGIHVQLMVTLTGQLQPLIEPRYIARLEERVYLAAPLDLMIPDVLVKKTPEPHRGPVLTHSRGTTPVVLEVPELEIHEPYIEIRDLYHQERVVAVIEALSPTNKAPGPGRRAYLRKQRRTLRRSCHLVEIDLLRQGRRVLRVPAQRLADLGPCDYLVCVNRWPKRSRFELYPCRLRDRLPILNIPLLKPDSDAPLDLQAALEKIYWEGRYMRTVRYSEPCIPPLEPADQEWANQCWAAYQAAHPELFSPTPPPA